MTRKEQQQNNGIYKQKFTMLPMLLHVRVKKF